MPFFLSNNCIEMEPIMMSYVAILVYTGGVVAMVDYFTSKVKIE